MLAIRTETELAQVARALAGKQTLSQAERRLFSLTEVADSRLVCAAGDLILAGEDPLGECFLALRTPEVRRGAGAVYTPRSLGRLFRTAQSSPLRKQGAGSE